VSARGRASRPTSVFRERFCLDEAPMKGFCRQPAIGRRAGCQRHRGRRHREDAPRRHCSRATRFSLQTKGVVSASAMRTHGCGAEGEILSWAPTLEFFAKHPCAPVPRPDVCEPGFGVIPDPLVTLATVQSSMKSRRRPSTNWEGRHPRRNTSTKKSLRSPGLPRLRWGRLRRYQPGATAGHQQEADCLGCELIDPAFRGAGAEILPD
jgi:hypothetical protein